MPEIQYATVSDFQNFGLPSTVTVADAMTNAHLTSWSRFVDGCVQSRCTVPLTTVNSDLVRLVCELASYTVLTIIGFNPESPNDLAVLTRYEAAKKYLEDIRDGMLVPTFLPVNAQADAESDGSRDWYPVGDLGRAIT